MPIYEYRCKACGKTHEIEHGFNDERPTRCPACGGTLVRVFHPVGVVFKGSGFHKTDYSGSGAKKTPSGEPSTSKPDAAKDAKPAAKTDSASAAPAAKPDKKSGESK